MASASATINVLIHKAPQDLVAQKVFAGRSLEDECIQLLLADKLLACLHFIKNHFLKNYTLQYTFLNFSRVASSCLLNKNKIFKNE